MYFPYFISYMVAGLAVSLVVFIWALNNGQFKDQQRARYLPLKDDEETPAAKVKKLAGLPRMVLFHGPAHGRS